MAMGALDGGRINIGSCSLGGAALAFDLAKDYLHGICLFAIVDRS